MHLGYNNGMPIPFSRSRPVCMRMQQLTGMPTYDGMLLAQFDTTLVRQSHATRNAEKSESHHSLALLPRAKSARYHNCQYEPGRDRTGDLKRVKLT